MSDCDYVMKVEPTLRCRRKTDSTRNLQTHVRDAVVEVILFLDKLDGLLSAGPILNLDAFGIGGLVVIELPIEDLLQTCRKSILFSEHIGTKPSAPKTFKERYHHLLGERIPHLLSGILIIRCPELFWITEENQKKQGLCIVCPNRKGHPSQ